MRIASFAVPDKRLITSESRSRTRGPGTDTGTGTSVSTSYDTSTSTGDEEECDAWNDNCPSGLKCMPVGAGGNGFAALKCMPVVAEPDGLGEQCEVLGRGLGHGLDTCDRGTLCWYNSYAGDATECISFCSGSEPEPICSPGSSCMKLASLSMGICLSECWPTDPEAECGPMMACVESLDAEFECAPDLSGDGGAFLTPCTEPLNCDPGRACRPSAVVAGCEHQMCCTPCCVLDSPYVSDADNGALKCPGSMQCRNLYDKDAPPFLGWAGVCEIP